MDSGRFETFVDAILAIMMTVMVLKIPQPEVMSFSGVWDLRIMYFAYIISFIVLFSIWDHHRKLFNIIRDINNRVIAVYSVLIFVITLVPYFTSWVAHNPNALVPELCFGILFVIIDALYIFSTEIAIRNDVHNTLTDDIDFKLIFILNLMMFMAGIAIAMRGYCMVMMVICLLTLVTWNVIPHLKKTYHVGDNHGK